VDDARREKIGSQASTVDRLGSGATMRDMAKLSLRWNTPYCPFLLVTAILLVNAAGCSSLGSAPNGKISVQAVSWTLVQKLAEPDAGLSGHKVTVLNPTDKSIVASGTTDSSGIIEFSVPAGTYTLLGASDEPETVQVQSGQTQSFKLVVHGKQKS